MSYHEINSFESFIFMTASASKERRSWFRVNEDVLFDYRLIDTHSAETHSPDEFSSKAFEIAWPLELRKIDHEANALLSIIHSSDRPLAEYLKKLNQKIDLLAAHCLNKSQAQSTNINISEGGISFISERALYKGNFIILRLIFLPSYTPMLTFASVHRCEAENDDTYRIGAQFYRLKEADRQELARQILQAQIKQKKLGASQESSL
jgi:hypothetical protein